MREPLDVVATREVAANPHQKDQHHAEREREAQEVMGVLGPLRPLREGIRAEQRQQQRPAECDAEARERENDEAGRRHPVHETLKRVEPHQRAAGAAAFEPHRPARQIEDDEEREHAQDCDATDPAQRYVAKLAPLAAGRLNEHPGSHVRNGDAALNHVQLLKQFLFVDGACLRVDRAIRIAILRGGGKRQAGNK
jgi:hypothetical protein